MSKLGMLAAGAVGYVLGARAGRERYDQIAAQAQRFWTNPRVQQASQQAQDYAREKAPEVGERVADVAKAAAVKATEVVTSGSGDESASGSATDGSAAKKAAAPRSAAKKSAAKKSSSSPTTNPTTKAP